MDFQDRNRDPIGKGKSQICLCRLYEVSELLPKTLTQMKLIPECEKDHQAKMKTPRQHFWRTCPICQYQLLVGYAILLF